MAQLGISLIWSFLAEMKQIQSESKMILLLFSVAASRA
jgi:hypothetical protein